MPSPATKRAPLAFSIRISPLERGFEVDTTPSHPVIAESVEDSIRRRVALRTDCSTIVSAPATGTPVPRADGPIAPAYVRRGLLQLAQVGAEQLHRANGIVEGYLYDAAVSAILGSMRDRAIPGANAIVLTVEPSIEPAMRVATYHWWRDMRHVVLSGGDGCHVRLCGVHHSEPFASWANARILAKFRRKLATHLGVPVAAIGTVPGLRAM